MHMDFDMNLRCLERELWCAGAVLVTLAAVGIAARHHGRLRAARRLAETQTVSPHLEHCAPSDNSSLPACGNWHCSTRNCKNALHLEQ